MFFVYILKSEKTKKYYIGCTTDIQSRQEQHNAGYNKSTKHGIPWELVCFKKFDSQTEAYLEEKKNHTKVELRSKK